MLRDLPQDLAASAIVTVATLIFTLTPLGELPVRIPLGLLMVLFVPGYALIAALFPRNKDLDWIERIALSFGLSIAVVPLIGLGLNYTPWGIRLKPVVLSLALFTLSMTFVAHLRRLRLPEGERLVVDIRGALRLIQDELFSGDSTRLDRALSVLLLISIIVSVAVLIYVIVTPKEGERFTEFYILGPNGKACDYPTQINAGEMSTVIVGVVNHEYSPVNYTIRIQLGDDVIRDWRISLEHNQTWEKPVTYIITRPGDLQKLEFLLFKEENFTAPYRDLHLWINVSRPEIRLLEKPLMRNH